MKNEMSESSEKSSDPFATAMNPFSDPETGVRLPLHEYMARVASKVFDEIKATHVGEMDSSYTTIRADILRKNLRNVTMTGARVWSAWEFDSAALMMHMFGAMATQECGGVAMATLNSICAMFQGATASNPLVQHKLVPMIRPEDVQTKEDAIQPLLDQVRMKHGGLDRDALTRTKKCFTLQRSLFFLGHIHVSEKGYHTGEVTFPVVGGAGWEEAFAEVRDDIGAEKLDGMVATVKELKDVVQQGLDQERRWIAEDPENAESTIAMMKEIYGKMDERRPLLAYC